jgi:intracellular septation protein A
LAGTLGVSGPSATSQPDASPSQPDVLDEVAQAALLSAQQISFKSLMLGNGPRFARDAFGPLLTFYVVWKLAGLVAGIAAATVVSLLAYRYEKRRDRSGVMTRISLAFVFVQAGVGLLSRSEIVYLAQPVLLNGVFGLAFLGSAALGRPLAGVFAQEFYPFPAEVRESRTFRRVFGTVSIAWGVYQCLRSAVRLLTLTGGSVEAFLVVNVVTGVPLTMGLMTWSIWWSIRAFRRSEEWGWALRGEAPPPGLVIGTNPATTSG